MSANPLPAVSEASPAVEVSASTEPDRRPLRIVIVGHVDHGKSTLVGRLFHDTGSLPDGKLEALQAMCERRGVPFEWAFLMDAFKSERDQNITIDTAQIWFSTEKRPYVIIDAPGHKEFLKNMVTGAAQADAAVLLIAADEGVQEQSRRHGTLLSLLGVKQVHVVVNKMDRVGYDQATFDKIEAEYTEFLQGLGVEPRGFVPVSAREGDNVAARSEATPWYTGPTVVEVLDGFSPPTAPIESALRFCVQDVYRFDHRRILAGRVESGRVRVGDTLLFQPNGKRSKVASIEAWSAPEQTEAKAGDSIGITLEEQIFVERGHVGVLDEDGARAAESDRVKARLFWLGKRPLEVGRKVKLKLATQEVPVHIGRIERVLDASSLKVRNDAEALARDDVAEVELVCERPVAFDEPDRSTVTGRFVIVDEYDLAGGGIVSQAPYAEVSGERREAKRYTPVTLDERIDRNGHRGAVVWLAGRGPRLEVARALERALFDRGLQVVVLDDARLRWGAGGEAGPGPVLLDVAKTLADAGQVVLALPLETVVPLAPGTDLFFEVRVGRAKAAYAGASQTRLLIDPEETGLEVSTAHLLEVLLPRLRNVQREWFYAI